METSKSKIGMISLIGLAVVGIIVFFMWWGATNREAELRTSVEAEQKVCQVHFDNMWKTIQGIADVADEYKEAFADIFPKIMEERYGGQRGGALLSFIKESNPHFDISLYSKVQNAISDERKEFTFHQDKLIDMERQHRRLLRTKPTSFFFNASDTIHITLVTSSRTNNAYVTGEDNDVSPFDRK